MKLKHERCCGAALHETRLYGTVIHGTLLLILLACIVICSGGCPQLVFFSDDGLESAIRAALSKPLGLLTEADLTKVVTLDARDYSIRDLSGIEYCNNLAWLDLDTNQISNLEPLAQLGRPESPFDSTLTYLNLNNNDISDIMPLAGLLNLKQLFLFGNQVTDITALVTNVEAGGALETVILDKSTLSDEAIDVDIPTLEAYGVNVIQATKATF